MYELLLNIICAHQIVTAAYSCVCDVKSTKARHIDMGSKIVDEKQSHYGYSAMKVWKEKGPFCSYQTCRQKICSYKRLLNLSTKPAIKFCLSTQFCLHV